MDKKENAAQAETLNGASNDTANATRRPPRVTGRRAQVLNVLRVKGSVLNVELKLEYGNTESSAQIFELVEQGFNISKITEPKIVYRGRAWRKVTGYVLGSPEWPLPGFFADEGNAA